MLLLGTAAYAPAVQPRAALNALITATLTSAMSGYVIGYQALRTDPEAFKRHAKFWAENLARGWGLEIELHGAERPEWYERCVVMANHQSHADVVALLATLPVAPVFLAKRELQKVPLFGKAMERGGHVFIDRGKHAAAIDTIEDAARNLRAGCPVLVFPEGTRGARREISRFKKGGFHLAKQAGVPIVPIGIRGSRDVWPRESFAAVPGRIEIHVGEAIPAVEVATKPVEETLDVVRARIGELSGLPLATGKRDADASQSR